MASPWAERKRVPAIQAGELFGVHGAFVLKQLRGTRGSLTNGSLTNGSLATGIDTIEAPPHFHQVAVFDQALRASDCGVIAHMRAGIDHRTLTFPFHDADFISVQGATPSLNENHSKPLGALLSTEFALTSIENFDEIFCVRANAKNFHVFLPRFAFTRVRDFANISRPHTGRAKAFALEPPPS